MILYEYVDGRGRGVISTWVEEELQEDQSTRLEEKLDLLGKEDTDLQTAKMLLFGTGNGNIFKLKIKGRVQLRPLLCYGPVNPRTELTLLLSAYERGDRLDPRDAVKRALERRAEVIADPVNRRRRYEQPETEAN